MCIRDSGGRGLGRGDRAPGVHPGPGREDVYKRQAFNTGSTTRQIAAEIWQAELQAINAVSYTHLGIRS